MRLSDPVQKNQSIATHSSVKSTASSSREKNKKRNGRHTTRSFAAVSKRHATIISCQKETSKKRKGKHTTIKGPLATTAERKQSSAFGKMFPSFQRHSQLCTFDLPPKTKQHDRRFNSVNITDKVAVRVCLEMPSICSRHSQCCQTRKFKTPSGRRSRNEADTATKRMTGARVVPIPLRLKERSLEKKNDDYGIGRTKRLKQCCGRERARSATYGGIRHPRSSTILHAVCSRSPDIITLAAFKITIIKIHGSLKGSRTVLHCVSAPYNYC